MKQITIDTNKLEWQEAEGYPQGTEIKILRRDEAGQTVILRLPAGFEISGHTHTRNEEHYVLEGQYEIGDKIYSQGTYQFFPANTSHGPFTSKGGAILLISWNEV